MFIVLVLLVVLLAWAWQAIRPPPPKICGSPGGPPVTAPRIKLRDGRHMAYREHGVSKEVARYKVIYIHGLRTCRHDLVVSVNISQGFFEELGLYVVSYDRPGYGESDPHPKQTVKSLALDIEELADQLDSGSKFYVMGNSIGGQLVWGCLKYIPHRLAGAALLAPVVNYWWGGFPANMLREAYYRELPQDLWANRVAHYIPWLTYWWNTQKWFPASTAVVGNINTLSPQDFQIISKIVGTNMSKTLLGYLHPNPKPKQIHTPNPISHSPSCLLWMAPFLSGGGYSSESWSYILALHEHMKNPVFKLAIEHHGDQESLDFWEGLPQHVKNLAFELYRTNCRMNETIVVCHSEPGAWNPPLFETFPCPPGAYRNFKSVIGRTMFETDRVNVDHVKRCNQMDYVWVPTEFHVSTFIESGVDPSKVVKIIQPVDVKFFDALKYKPLDLSSIGKLVLGSTTQNLNSKKEFIFLSIFKWEYRKGWDVLLKSYFKEFSGVDGVALYLLTNPYHSDRDFGNKIVEFVENSDIEKPVDGWAPVYVIDSHIAQIDLPRLYKAANAFVLPTRGEGWGRPLVEAMAMSLPVIATNWSGPTEYLTEENSYPLPADRMSEVTEGPFRGHLWAEPSVDKLRVLMRHVMNNVEEAKVKGRQAGKGGHDKKVLS